MYNIETQFYKKMSTEMNQIKLLPKQNTAFDLMVKGKNVFVTGPAGVGKTILLKMFVKIYKKSKIIGVTSTTGTSALLFGGTTLHSFLGIGLGNGSSESLSKKITSKKYLANRWKHLEILVIDEISMLSPELFDKLEEIARIVRKNDKPFGGIQLILSGDFCQLPCIGSDKFCFESKTWDICLDNTIYLTQIVRQSENDFQICLNNVRLGKLPKETKKILKDCLNKKIDNSFGIKPTKLFSTNRSVDEINEQELDILAETGIEFKEYNMETYVYTLQNKEYIISKYKKSCQAVEVLQLCIGAQVMLIINLDLDNQLANGSRGVVTRFEGDTPVVKFMCGIERIIDYNIWEHESNDVKEIRIIQIPLKIAYATNFHKSQGMTLDCIEIDISDCFEYGQAYIGLSRVKSLYGLSIKALDFEKIKAHPKALEYYKYIE
jgi:ATP-dependent DNA helicase PIF1